MTAAGWVDVMFDGMDSRGLDLQPKRDERIWLCSFFIVFMLVSQTIVLNLIVAVMVEKFSMMSDREAGYRDISVTQRRWIDLQRLMIRQKLKRKWTLPEN